MSKNFDYRKFYKEYYGIDFGSEYSIHHIDFNRDNNSIHNLILLPKRLHRRYHFVLNALGAEGGIIKNFNLQMDGQMNEPLTDYQRKMLINFLNIAEELKEWQKYKNILDYKVYMEERDYASNENKQKPCCNRQQNIQ